MQQSAGADERNSSDSLEDRNAGAQLNDSFQFNRATMVMSEHKSTAEARLSTNKEVSGYSSGQVRVEGKIDITSSLQIDTP